MKINLLRTEKGITLIALVITIIVLLILAGVSIAMLTGENGILTKAQTASDETKQKGAEEKVKLAVAGSWGNDGKLNIEELKNNLNNIEGIDKSTIKDNLPMIVKVDKIEVNIENNGRVNAEETGKLPSADNTKPYFPNEEFSKVSGTDLDTGLVIKDKDENTYVWVEVPQSIYTTATSSEDYTNIEADMIKYASDYRESKFLDVWYKESPFTEKEYNNLKNNMLKSVYENGGFWISQYEAGTYTIRTSASSPITPAVSKEGAYPYNYVSLATAQKLSQQMDSGKYTSSLLFGIQWDLTMKNIENKKDKTKEQIKINSIEWGNYNKATFEIYKGEYSADKGKSYTKIINKYIKPEGTTIILTTGATDRNKSLNIYDLAANVGEWTLEKNTKSMYPATLRGQTYNNSGPYVFASIREPGYSYGTGEYTGFHITIF